MGGTREGGLKAAKTIKTEYGEDFYKKRMGKIGGKARVPKGYGSLEKDKNGLTGLQRAKLYGSIGGQISRRKPQKGKKNAVGNKTKKQRTY